MHNTTNNVARNILAYKNGYHIDDVRSLDFFSLSIKVMVILFPCLTIKVHMTTCHKTWLFSP
jgi:hypothetical protein